MSVFCGRGEIVLIQRCKNRQKRENVFWLLECIAIRSKKLWRQRDENKTNVILIENHYVEKLGGVAASCSLLLICLGEWRCIVCFFPLRFLPNQRKMNSFFPFFGTILSNVTNVWNVLYTFSTNQYSNCAYRYLFLQSVDFFFFRCSTFSLSLPFNSDPSMRLDSPTRKPNLCNK